MYEKLLYSQSSEDNFYVIIFLEFYIKSRKIYNKKGINIECKIKEFVCSKHNIHKIKISKTYQRLSVTSLMAFAKYFTLTFLSPAKRNSSILCHINMMASLCLNVSPVNEKNSNLIGYMLPCSFYTDFL